MPEPVLTFAKYLFLAILYLFFLRVLRAVWIELREPKGAATDQHAGTDPRATAGAPQGADGMAPPPTLVAGSPLAGSPLAGATLAGATLAGAPRLVVRTPGNGDGAVFDLVGETTVGRSPGCGLALPDDSFVSSIHARLYRRDGAAWVEDLGSTNGTFVNGRRLDGPSVLHAGDLLRVGQSELELVG